MTIAETLDLLRSSQSAEEWDEYCQLVKQAFDGAYPDWWYTIVIASGIADEVLKSFNTDTKIQVQLVDKTSLEI